MKKNNPTKFSIIIYCNRRGLFFSFFFVFFGPFYFIVIAAAVAVSGRRPRTLLVSACIAMFGPPPPPSAGDVTTRPYGRSRIYNNIHTCVLLYTHNIIIYNRPVPSSCRFKVYPRRRNYTLQTYIRYTCMQGDGFRQIGGVITGPDRRDTD